MCLITSKVLPPQKCKDSIAFSHFLFRFLALQNEMCSVSLELCSLDLFYCGNVLQAASVIKDQTIFLAFPAFHSVFERYNSGNGQHVLKTRFQSPS